MSLEELAFSMEKRYSLPVLVLLYFRKELTFDQIYDLSVGYRGECLEAKRKSGVLGEKKGKYGAISRESISRAINELVKMRCVKKEAKLGKSGRAHTIYVLTEATRKLMENFIRPKT